MSSFIGSGEYQGPLAGVAGAGPLGVLDDVVVAQAGDALDVCSAVTVVFHGITMAGFAGAIFVVTGTRVHGAVGATGSFMFCVTCSDL